MQVIIGHEHETLADDNSMDRESAYLPASSYINMSDRSDLVRVHIVLPVFVLGILRQLSQNAGSFEPS